MKLLDSKRHLFMRYPSIQRTVEIVFGFDIIRSLPSLVDPTPRRAFLIADDTVASLYADEVADIFRSSGIETSVLTFVAGEASKNRRMVALLQDRLIAEKVERGSCIVALGGGVCCDLAGFVAASLLRGLRLVCIPTTLVAMIDAAIGGKVAIDHPRGKNLIGFFYPAELILADLRFLKTLPIREWKNGLSELVKIAVVADRDLFEAITCSSANLKKPSVGEHSELIFRAIELKAGIVEKDPYERSLRSILNFGHTIGHAIEREFDYSGRHGEAVAIGMALESKLAVRLNVLGKGDAEEIEGLIKRLGLPHRLPVGLDVRRLVSHVGFDKKRRDGVVYFSLPVTIGRMAKSGKMWGVPVDHDVLFEFLKGEP